MHLTSNHGEHKSRGWQEAKGRPIASALNQARPGRNTGARNAGGEVAQRRIERKQHVARPFDTNGLAGAPTPW
eukprot:8526342-Alexandrium_andersonii.AAC.1